MPWSVGAALPFPHIARKLVGTDYRAVIFASAWGGAVLVTYSDVVAGSGDHRGADFAHRRRDRAGSESASRDSGGNFDGADRCALLFVPGAGGKEASIAHAYKNNPGGAACLARLAKQAVFSRYAPLPDRQKAQSAKS